MKGNCMSTSDRILNEKQAENDAYENFKDRISMLGRPEKLSKEEIENLREQGRI